MVIQEPGGSGEARSVPRAGLSEYAIAVLLAALGVLVLLETQSIHEALVGNNPVGPRLVPSVVGVFLVLVAALLAIDITRGGRGEAEGGEDVDLSMGTDWLTLGSTVALFAACGQLIPVIGFPVSGMLLFFGAARLLGSRSLLRDAVVSVVFPLAAFLLFTLGLGVYLPPGPQ